MNKYLVEFIATAFFVYVILATGNPIAIGLALIIAIMVAAPISGGHVNPAVSVVMICGGLVAYEFYRRVKV
jgi:glycerol uptake facilitator-like aquaporin